ncbi:MAG: hypothetical protein NC926_03630, partial [Candidatus Omnitrophica bacterium]|nr:hypothetical protein [Candidatus Omnitrophota bacterium]
MEIYPNFEEFKFFSQKANIIPLYFSLLSDFETPITSFLKIAKGSFNFLFESAEQEEKIGRYSFIGSYPEIIVKGKGEKVEIINYKTGEKKFITKKLPLKIIEDYLEKYKVPNIKNFPPFFGGFVGFVSYDYVRQIERLPEITKDELAVPDFILFFPKKIIIFDHFNRKIFLITNIFIEDKNDIRNKYEEGKKFLLNFIEEFQKPLKIIENSKKEERGFFRSNSKKDIFLKNVEKVKRYIFEGDIIQAVISQ